MSSETSSCDADADADGMKVAKGECAKECAEEEGSGRIGVSSFVSFESLEGEGEGDLMERRTVRVMGSVCAIERKFDQ